MLRSSAMFSILAMCLATVMAINFSTNETETLADEDSTSALKRDKRTFDLNLPLDLSSIVNAIKDQVMDITLEIGAHIGKYILNMFHECKLRLLKKLSKHKLSDVFRMVFDEVANSILKASPVLSDHHVAAVVDPVELEPAPELSFSPYALHPRLAPIASLFS